MQSSASHSQNKNIEQPQSLKRLDWAILVAFPAMIACLVVFGVADAWIGRPRQYIVFYWLSRLVFFGLFFVVGAPSLMLPHKVVRWYKRVNNQLSNTLRIGRSRVIAPVRSNGGISMVYTFLLGLLFTSVGGLAVWSITKDMLTRPECFFSECGFP
jgi:hypothetical protein